MIYIEHESVNFILALENRLLDFRLKNRGVQETSGKIGILAIDERSVEQLGRWPFKRRDMAIFLQKLRKTQARLVGFDVTFSEPERPFVSEERGGLVQKYKKMVLNNRDPRGKQSFYKHLKNPSPHSKGDRDLKKALKDFNNRVVLGWFYFIDEEEVDTLDTDFKKEEKKVSSVAIEPVFINKNYSSEEIDKGIMPNSFFGLRANTKFLSNASKLNGFFSNQPDEDGIYRWAHLVGSFNGKLYPALSLTMAADILNSDILVRIDDTGLSSLELWDRNDEKEPIIIPTDVKRGKLLINYRGPEKTFPHYSFYDIYRGKLGKKELKDKLLLLGATAAGIFDIRPTPFSETNPGVEIHANILDNIITQEFLKRDKDIFLYELILVLCIGIIFGLIIDSMKALTSALSVIIFSISYFFIDDYLFFRNGTWTYMAVPYLEIMSIYFGVTIFKYFTEEKERKKVRGAFQYYLNASVIEQILENPSSLQLGGEKKELTVFFSDVRGFTTISESLSPEKLTKILNEYFTPMTDIILKHDGLLDKYMGDAIMAVWGAPIDMPGHAYKAVISGVEMLEILTELQTKWIKENIPPIDIGIGINTGLMTVGNMGSDQRFDYTVMGDSVNLGSRLEGINKTYGSRIIVSHSSYNHVKNTPLNKIIRPLDLVKVKGKTEPVAIYQVLEPVKYKAVNDDIIGNFTQGFQLYKKQSWDPAISKFKECLKVYPDDDAAKLYIDRCNELKKSPPGKDWDGVYVFTTK